MTAICAVFSAAPESACGTRQNPRLLQRNTCPAIQNAVAMHCAVQKPTTGTSAATKIRCAALCCAAHSNVWCCSLQLPATHCACLCPSRMRQPWWTSLRDTAPRHTPRPENANITHKDCSDIPVQLRGRLKLCVTTPREPESKQHSKFHTTPHSRLGRQMHLVLSGPRPSSSPACTGTAHPAVR
jgi:hypothetical protein